MVSPPSYPGLDISVIFDSSLPSAVLLLLLLQFMAESLILKGPTDSLRKQGLSSRQWLSKATVAEGSREGSKGRRGTGKSSPSHTARTPGCSRRLPPTWEPQAAFALTPPLPVSSSSPLPLTLRAPCLCALSSPCPRPSSVFPLGSLPETQVSFPVDGSPFSIKFTPLSKDVTLLPAPPCTSPSSRHVYIVLNKLCPNCPTTRALLSHCQEGFFFYLLSLKSRLLFLAQVKCSLSPLLVKLSPLSRAKMNLTLLPAHVLYPNFCYSSEHILPCIVSYSQVRIFPLEDWSFRTAQSRNMLSLKSKAVSYKQKMTEFIYPLI